MKKRIAIITLVTMICTMIPSVSMASVAKPSKVGKIVATGITTSSFNLRWAKASNTTGYRIYKYSNKKYVKYKTYKASTLAKAKRYKTYTYKGKTVKGYYYPMTKLKAGTKYYYKVRAYRVVNGKTYWGKTSSAFSVTTKKPTPITYKTITSAGLTTDLYISEGVKDHFAGEDIKNFMAKANPDYLDNSTEAQRSKDTFTYYTANETKADGAVGECVDVDAKTGETTLKNAGEVDLYAQTSYSRLKIRRHLVIRNIQWKNPTKMATSTSCQFNVEYTKALNLKLMDFLIVEPKSEKTNFYNNFKFEKSGVNTYPEYGEDFTPIISKDNISYRLTTKQPDGEYLFTNNPTHMVGSPCIGNQGISIVPIKEGVLPIMRANTIIKVFKDGTLDANGLLIK